MRVIHFPKQGIAQFDERPMPVCGPGQILVKTEFSGVSNGTERSFLMGGPYGGSTWPCQCGYQTVGRVVEMARDVTGYAVGDRVFSGIFRHHAEYLALDVAKGDAPENITAVLPETIDPMHAALFGVGGVSVHDVRHVRTGLGDRVLVVGAGVIGQFAAQAAQAAGAETWLANRSEDRLEVARQCGVRHTVQITGDETWQALQKPGFDVVIDDSGADILDKIIGLGFGKPGVLRRGGRLFLCAGRFEIKYASAAAQAQRLEIYHTTHFKRTDLLELIRLVDQGTINVGPIIRDVVPVADAPAIYEQMRDNPHSLLGTVFDWR